MSPPNPCWPSALVSVRERHRPAVDVFPCGRVDGLASRWFSLVMAFAGSCLQVGGQQMLVLEGPSGPAQRAGGRLEALAGGLTAPGP